MSNGVCPGCGGPIAATDDLASTVSCGNCRATIIPGEATLLTIVSTNADSQPSGAALVPLPGTFIKRYEIQNLLGTGTAGAVYLARHRESGAPRALKIMTGKGADRVRFEREAKMLESVRHPALIQLYEAGEMDGHPYLVLEYAPGGSLRKRLKQPPRFTMREALDLTIPLLSGLQVVHEKGIIHRDLKPDNILLTGPTTGKIADLGVALLETESRLTSTGALVGTPLYMAPEQLQAQDVDATADLHAMALILHELLTGDLPFKGKNLAELLTAKLTHNPPPIQTLVPDLPPRIAAVIQSALERSPAKRPKSAAEFAQELQRGLAKEPAKPRPKPVPSAKIPAPPPPAPARTMQVAGIAAATVALLAGAFLFRPRPAPDPSPTPSIALPPPTPGPTATASPTPVPTSTPTPLPSIADPVELAVYPEPETTPSRHAHARAYGPATLPPGLLVPQRFTHLTHLGATGDLAALWTTPDRAVTAFDARTRELKLCAPVPPGVTLLTADPTGTHAFAGTEKGELYDISRTPGSPSRRLAAIGTPIVAIAAPDADRVLFAHMATLEARRTANGNALATTRFDANITALAAAKDRAAVAFAADLALLADGAWDKPRRVPLPNVTALQMTPERVLALDGADTLAVVDLASAQVTRACKVEQGPIRRFAISSDGALVATATDKVAEVWDLKTGSRRQGVDTRGLPIRSLAFADKNRVIAVVVDLEESTSVPTSELIAVDLTTKQSVHATTSIGPVRRCAYAADGRTLLTSGDHPPEDTQPGLIGWDTSAGTARFSFRAPTSYVLASDFASRSFFMVQDGLEERGLADGKLVKKFAGNPVMIDVSADDSRLAMLVETGEVRLVERKTAKELWRSGAGNSGVHLNKDGKVVTLLRVNPGPAAVAEVWEPVKNALLQTQKLDFLGADKRSAFRPVLMLAGGRPAFGSLAEKALAGLPPDAQARIPRESLPLSEASQVTLHRAGDHVFALAMPGSEPGPARAVLHWVAGHGDSPDLWSPPPVSPFATAELTSLAVSPDGRRLAVGTSVGAVLELDIERLWPH